MFLTKKNSPPFPKGSYKAEKVNFAYFTGKKWRISHGLLYISSGEVKSHEIKGDKSFFEFNIWFQCKIKHIPLFFRVLEITDPIGWAIQEIVSEQIPHDSHAEYLEVEYKLIPNLDGILELTAVVWVKSFSS